ncbi:MAG: hypothetical protein JWM85_1476 [Acidimicrobiaceae bacterium]|nr:hypothetical protein [Acidimicrobiaceae bacterium]
MREAVDRDEAGTALAAVRPRPRLALVAWRSVVIGVAALLAVAPIIGTPYFGDDALNAPLPKVLAKLHLSSWHYIGQGTVTWMRWGRFFPGAMADEVVVFTTLTSRVVYKSYLLVLLCCLILAASRWVAVAFGSKAVAIFGVVALVSSWQLRYPVAYDGLAGFLGLVPWTMLLMVGSVLVLGRRPSSRAPAALIAGGAIWALAAVTYEYSLILAPAFVAWFWLASGDLHWRRRAAVAIAFPTCAVGAFDLWLRHHVVGIPSPEYAISLHAGPFLSTTAKELVSALPLSEYWVPGPARPAVHVAWLAILGAVVLAVLVLIVLRRAWMELPIVESRRLWLAAAIGGWIWLAPAVLTGATLRWQQDVVWGQSYIPMLFETLGTMLLIATGMCALRRRNWGRRGPLGVMSAAVALTVLLNFGVVVG